VTLEEEEKKLADDFAEEAKHENDSDGEDRNEIKTSVAFKNVS
jgi:hypothetical protein